ncbi:hypothetical protein HGB07_00065 [Candidatus Roizmanbacteria bacterium]|nr:hypothetical protein [Candidatus Roizmanbacteria bacterium]
MTLVKYVIRLKGLVIATVFVLAYALIPNGIFKLYLSPAIILAWVFFIGSLFRSYLWLTDLVTDLNTKEDGYFEAGSSYRFARVVFALVKSDDVRPWNSIWREPRLPFDFEDELHDYFLSILTDNLSHIDDLRAISRSIDMLKMYEKYIVNRYSQKPVYLSYYLERFLDMFYNNEVMLDSSDLTYADLYAKISELLLKITKKIFIDSSKDEFSTNVFELMRDFHTRCTDVNINFLGTDKNKHAYSMMRNFLFTTFDSIFDGTRSISTEDEFDSIFITDSTMVEWRVKHYDLCIKKSLGLVVVQIYKSWIFNKFDEIDSVDFERIDYVTEFVFPDTDEVAMSNFYWFMLNIEGLDSYESVLYFYTMKSRPMDIMIDIKLRELRNDSYADVLQSTSLIDNVARLLATMFYDKFNKRWDIDTITSSLMAISNSSSSDLSKVKKEMVLEIVELLKRIQAFHDRSKRKSRAEK